MPKYVQLGVFRILKAKQNLFVDLEPHGLGSVHEPFLHPINPKPWTEALLIDLSLFL